MLDPSSGGYVLCSPGHWRLIVAANPTRDEELQCAVDAVARCGSKTGAAVALELNLSTLTHRLREAARRGLFSIVERPKPVLVTRAQSILTNAAGDVEAIWDKQALPGRFPE